VTAHTDPNLLGASAPVPPEARAEGGAASATPQERRRLAAAIERHHQLVWRTLRRFGVAERDVEDAAQQVFLTFLTNMETLPAGKEAPYLVAIAVRVAANARRKQQRAPELAGEAIEAAASASTPEGLLGEKQLREELDRALATLPLEQRAVFVLYELEGFTLPEIAESLEIPLGTATSRLRRARGHFEEWAANRRAAGGKP
jgi:RNA polymerase sigma-70 factor (ECF subfamily)